MADERTAEEQKALEDFAAHPGLPKPGNMSSRSGEPYNPVDVPNDTSGNAFLNSFPAADAPTDQPQQAVPTPTGEQPAVEATPKATPEAVPAAPETPAATPEEQSLYFGKYKNREAAEKAWQKREELLRDRQQENIALKAATSVMEGVGFRKEREQPTPPANIPVQFDGQGQPFIPADIFDKRVEQRAGEIASERVQETLQPIANMNNITNKMQQEFPDFGNDNADYSAYLAENPELAQRVNNDPEFAMPATYLMFKELRGQRTQADAVQTTQRSQTVVNEARAQASAGAPVAQSSRTVQEGESRERKLQDLESYARSTGDWRPYRKFRIEEALNMDGTLEAIAKAGWGR